MFECPVCQSGSHEKPLNCVNCGFVVRNFDGFESWAPELAVDCAGGFYKPEHFKELAVLEDAHFWFQARNELILWSVANYFGNPVRFAEIGCGTGFVLRAVELTFPSTELVGTELFVEGLKFAKHRCNQAHLVQLDARRLPYRNHFNVVGIFDVLEHIEEDEVVLAELWKSLVPGGGLLITVPQHQWLWSAVDVTACHARRYSARDLEAKVEAAGFEILRSTSFVSLLLPLLLASRRTSARQMDGPGAELSINKYLNWLFGKIMKAEFGLIRYGVDFFAGGSRLLIARKKINDSI